MTVGPAWATFRGWIYGNHCSKPYRRIGSISWSKSVLIRVAEAVLSSMDRRAKAALVALRSITLLRSALVSERHKPR